MNQFPTIKPSTTFKVAFIVWIFGVLASIAVGGGLLYVAIHFIKKFW
jgi:hypothetical protein